MDSTGITPVMPVGSGYGEGFGGGSFMYIFGLLILLGLFNGGFNGFGGNGNTNAVQADVNRGFDNQNLQAQTRDILNAVTSGTAQSVAATNQTFHDTLTVLNDKYGEIARDVANVQIAQANALANQNECCCNTLRAIDGVNYNGAINTAAINANTTAMGQKILDAITGNRMADTQNQINALQLQNQLSGVVRYPTNTYYAVPSPCFGGCGCGNI